MLRYIQLEAMVSYHKPRVILEIGTHRCQSARMMIKAAAEASPGEKITYIGLDLFEKYTPEIGAEEFNGKSPPMTNREAYDELTSFARANDIRLQVMLYPGKTEDTLNNALRYVGNVDFAFVDGGHSLKTVSHDLSQLRNHGVPVIVADDYYVDRTDVGCKPYVDSCRDTFALFAITDKVKDKSGNSMSITMAVQPATAYPWTRYNTLFKALEQIQPETVAAVVDDKHVRAILAVLQGMYQFRFVDDPAREPKLDLAFFSIGNQDDAGDLFEVTKHAARVVVDSVDKNGGEDPPLLELFKSNSSGEFGLATSVEPLTLAVWPKEDFKIDLNVKTRNCVDASHIRKNIVGNGKLIKNWAVPCRPHGRTAVIVSAGRSLKDQFVKEAIVKLAEEQNMDVYCVKHSISALNELGVEPFGIILLDPRHHVGEFVVNASPKSHVFIASMCPPDVAEMCLSRGRNVIGYNALLNDFSPKDFLEMTGSGVAVPGGSAASTRGIALLHLLGYRKFECFAFDLDNEAPHSTHLTGPKTPGAANASPQGYDKHVTVEYGGRVFHTELELIAQAEDIKTLYGLIDQSKLNDWADVELNFHGNNMGQHVAHSTPRLSQLPEFEDLLNGRATLPSRKPELSFKII